METDSENDDDELEDSMTMDQVLESIRREPLIRRGSKLQDNSHKKGIMEAKALSSHSVHSQDTV